MKTGINTPQNTNDKEITDAAEKAAHIVGQVLSGLPKAEQYNYSGHVLKIGEYDVCVRCTSPIAEAQQAYKAILLKSEHEDDPTVREHLEAAADLFKAEAKAAELRAELHNGQNAEPIVNSVLGFIHDRKIYDEYDHSHQGI